MNQCEEQDFPTEIKEILIALDEGHGNIYRQVILPKLEYVEGEEGGRIYGYVEEIIKALLPIGKLSNFNDPTLVRLLCNAFYGKAGEVKETDQSAVNPTDQSNAEADTWDKCQAPIFAALLVVYVSDQMEKAFKKAYELDWVDVFHKQKEQFDINAHELFDHCYRDPTKPKPGRVANKLLSEANPVSVTSLLEIADRANASKFLAHPCAQRFVDELWEKGEKVKDTNPEKGAKNEERQGLAASAEKGNPSTDDKKRTPFFTPRRLFRAHAAFYLLFLLLYGLSLQHLHLIGENFAIQRTHWLTWCAYGLLGWQMTFIWETFVINDYAHDDYWSFLWKYRSFQRYAYLQIWLLIITVVFLFVAHIAILLESDPSLPFEGRGVLIVLYEFFFYINFIYCSLRSLLFMASTPFFGTIIITIETMSRTFYRFFPLIFVFWLIYSVVQNSLLGTSWGFDSPWAMFIHGAFELMQDTQDDTKFGNVSMVGKAGCENKGNSSEDWVLQAQCWLRRGLSPLLLFCYIKHYDEAYARADDLWNSRRLRRALFYQRAHFPPPLNIVVDLFSNCCCKRGDALRKRQMRGNDYCYGKFPTQDAPNSPNDEKPDLRAVEEKHLTAMLQSRNTSKVSNAEIDALKKELLQELIKEINNVLAEEAASPANKWTAEANRHINKLYILMIMSYD
ncbi:unnamed protein product, partial [Mesorhabditis belari]|uniref:Ion transport domain-containing protein n=1 Tax=Mesorhabditis belari TaxID=2138241 RepID=A0AAF3ERE7_9BILA